jgi:hypothetical protein
MEAHDPLTETERAELLDDLGSLESFQQILEPTGIRGLVVECPDCREPHYFDWGLLKNNLTHVLGDNSPRIHEPAFDPNPDDYVTWDYARGYTDCWSDIYADFDDEDVDDDKPADPPRPEPPAGAD